MKIVTKKCWEQTARKKFSRYTRIVRAKILKKNRRKEVRKNVFLYSHEYRDQKMGGGNRPKQFFQKHTNSASKKCWVKNVGKKCEKRFLYSYEYPDQKMVGKNARNNFSRNTLIVQAKNVGEKIVGKK